MTPWLSATGRYRVPLSLTLLVFVGAFVSLFNAMVRGGAAMAVSPLTSGVLAALIVLAVMLAVPSAAVVTHVGSYLRRAPLIVG